MTIDKPEHQQFLLELMKAATYPGHLLELAMEVKRSIENAEVSGVDTPADPTQRMT